MVCGRARVCDARVMTSEASGLFTYLSAAVKMAETVNRKWSLEKPEGVSSSMITVGKNSAVD